MPYDNVPESLWGKMDDCVKSVMEDGKDKEAAIAICHASIVKKEIAPQIETLKQADGKIRWILFSSSSYEDHEGEIVSQKALEDDTARMDATREYGTLDWWHTPIILGDCDFSAMHGRISIESGTFRDDAIGTVIAQHAKELGASRTFYNPITQPDADGVYHNIRTVSRAILPAERASNALTRVMIAKEKTMFEDKIKKLKELLGNTPDGEQKVDALLAAAEQTDKAAQGAGLTAKETQTPETPPTAPEEKKAWFVADMTPEEFDTRLQSAVEKFLTPAVKEIGAHIAALNEAQTKTAKERDDKIVAQIQTAQEMQTALNARLAALEGLQPRAYRATQDPQTATTKEVVGAVEPKGNGDATRTLGDWLARA